MPDHTSETSSSQSQRACLYLLLGFTGGGLGAMWALSAGAASWPDAKLFIVLCVAIGIALAVALAPNLLTTQDREANAPKQ